MECNRRLLCVSFQSFNLFATLPLIAHMLLVLYLLQDVLECSHISGSPQQLPLNSFGQPAAFYHCFNSLCMHNPSYTTPEHGQTCIFNLGVNHMLWYLSSCTGLCDHSWPTNQELHYRLEWWDHDCSPCGRRCPWSVSRVCNNGPTKCSGECIPCHEIGWWLAWSASSELQLLKSANQIRLILINGLLLRH